MIRFAKPDDANECAEIYNYYVLNGIQTFETEPMTVDSYRERIAAVLSKGYPFLVLEENCEIKAFAYLAEFNPRYAYRFTSDLSIYVRQDALGSGLGSALYAAVEKEATDRGYRKIISIITAENSESVAFHKKHGFREEGHLVNVGYKFDRWIDVFFYAKDI